LTLMNKFCILRL